MAKYQLTVDGKTFDVEVGDVSSSPVSVTVNGVAKSVAFATGAAPAPATLAPVAAVAVEAAPEPEAAPAPVAAPAADAKVVVAPMPGKILSVTVSVGQTIAQGDTVCTLEAMKMEMPISSTADGTVAAIHVAVGENVANDAPLVSLS